MGNKEKRASKNEKFVKKIRRENKAKQEYKVFIVNDYNYYNNNDQEYYYSIR